MKRLSLTGLVLLGAVGCTRQYDAEVTGRVKEAYCMPNWGDKVETSGGEVFWEGDVFKYTLNERKIVVGGDEDGTLGGPYNSIVLLYLGKDNCEVSDSLKIPAGERMYARGMIDDDGGSLRGIEELRQLTPEERQVWPREK